MIWEKTACVNDFWQYFCVKNTTSNRHPGWPHIVKKLRNKHNTNQRSQQRWYAPLSQKRTKNYCTIYNKNACAQLSVAQRCERWAGCRCSCGGRKGVARQCFAIVRMIVMSLVLCVGAMYSNGKRLVGWLSRHQQ